MKLTSNATQYLRHARAVTLVSALVRMVDMGLTSEAVLIAAELGIDIENLNPNLPPLAREDRDPF